MAPLAWVQATEAEGLPTILEIDSHPNQSQCGKPYGCCHPSDLPVAAFLQAELKPTGGNREPRADWGISGGPWRVAQEPRPRFKSPLLLDRYPTTELIELRLSGFTLHLDVVGAPVAPAGLTQSCLKATIRGQHQESFAVGIEAAGGIHPGDGDELGEGAPAAARLRSELAEHSIGLVQ